MTERKYSVSELDALRRAVENKWLYGCYDFRRAVGGFSRMFHEYERTNAVEQMVRTHILAGHTAEDLYASEEPPTKDNQESRRTIKKGDLVTFLLDGEKVTIEIKGVRL